MEKNNVPNHQPDYHRQKIEKLYEILSLNDRIFPTLSWVLTWG
jgi:hypothetical protein